MDSKLQGVIDELQNAIDTAIAKGGTAASAPVVADAVSEVFQMKSVTDMIKTNTVQGAKIGGAKTSVNRLTSFTKEKLKAAGVSNAYFDTVVGEKVLNTAASLVGMIGTHLAGGKVPHADKLSPIFELGYQGNVADVSEMFLQAIVPILNEFGDQLVDDTVESEPPANIKVAQGGE